MAAAELIDHVDAPLEGFDPWLGVDEVGAAVFGLAEAAVFHGVDEQLVREAGREVRQEAVTDDPVAFHLVKLRRHLHDVVPGFGADVGIETGLFKVGAIPEEVARASGMGQPVQRALPGEVGDGAGHEVALVEVVAFQEILDGAVKVTGGELAEGVPVLVGDVGSLTGGDGGHIFGCAVDGFTEVAQGNSDVGVRFLKDLDCAFNGRSEPPPDLDVNGLLRGRRHVAGCLRAGGDAGSEGEAGRCGRALQEVAAADAGLDDCGFLGSNSRHVSYPLLWDGG